MLGPSRPSHLLSGGLEYSQRRQISGGGLYSGEKEEEGEDEEGRDKDDMTIDELNRDMLGYADH